MVDGDQARLVWRGGVPGRADLRHDVGSELQEGTALLFSAQRFQSCTSQVVAAGCESSGEIFVTDYEIVKQRAIFLLYTSFALTLASTFLFS